MTTTTTPRILAHGIGGGFDLRHEGCAAKCCEAEAEPVADLHRGTHAATHCGGCDGLIINPPAPMDFDRDAKCETHAETTHTIAGERIAVIEG